MTVSDIITSVASLAPYVLGAAGVFMLYKLLQLLHKRLPRPNPLGAREQKNESLMLLRQSIVALEEDIASHRRKIDFLRTKRDETIARGEDTSGIDDHIRARKVLLHNLVDFTARMHAIWANMDYGPLQEDAIDNTPKEEQ